MSARIKTGLRGLVSLLLAAGLISLVLARSQVDVWEELSQAEPGYLILAFLLFGTGTALGSYRWGLLLKVLDIDLSFFTLFRLNLIASFFLLAFPGGVGGDVAKIYYLTRDPAKATEAVLTIFLDRVMGLLGLLTVALLSLGLAGHLLTGGSRELKLAASVVALAAIGGLLFVLGFYLAPLFGRNKKMARLFESLMARLPERVKAIAQTVFTALGLLRHRPGVMLAGLTLSTMLHSLIALAVWSIGIGTHTVGLKVGDYFLATQVANTVAAIPLTPGGLGGRDLVLNLFFEAAGADPAKAAIIPTIVTIIFVAWGLIGGIFYVFEKSSIWSKEDSPAAE